MVLYLIIRRRRDLCIHWVAISHSKPCLLKHDLMAKYIHSTGTKCLPSTKPALLASGHVLHDWHAEIVAIRAFNHFLLNETLNLACKPEYRSCILTKNTSDDPRSGPVWDQPKGAMEDYPFSVSEGLKIMMYTSEAPCGDASMELVMEAQEDATPWPISSTTSLQGRGSFGQLGIVRRKPCT